MRFERDDVMMGTVLELEVGLPKSGPPRYGVKYAVGEDGDEEREREFDTLKEAVRFIGQVARGLERGYAKLQEPWKAEAVRKGDA